MSTRFCVSVRVKEVGAARSDAAAAETRTVAVQQANNAIDKCFSDGGTPDAGVSSDGSIAVSCRYRRPADNTVCTWEAGSGYKMNCSLVAGADTHPPIGGGVLDGAQVTQDQGGVPRLLNVPAPQGHHTHHKNKGDTL